MVAGYILRPFITWCILGLVQISQGLLCYECYNARSDEECILKGRIAVCTESQKSCQTTERIDRVYGPYVKISKRCKQAKACQNNFDQNKKIMPQCKHFKDLSVCRCCCTDSLCNYSTDTCTGVTNKRLLKEPKRMKSCPKLPTSIKNGVMACDDTNRPGSNCVFRCLTFFDLKGPGSIYCQYKKNRAKWTGKVPCCTRPCPPYAEMDLVIGVDSSFESLDDWKKMKKFLNAIVGQFVIGLRETRIGIITFKDKIAESQEIYLSSYNNSIDLLTAVDNMELNTGLGKGTRTGQLLNHVNVVSFSSTHGNRKDVRDLFILVTAGKPVKERSDPEIISKLMQDNGIQIVTVGVGTSVDVPLLESIAGSSDSVIYVESGFETLAESKYINRLAKILCGDTCS